MPFVVIARSATPSTAAMRRRDLDDVGAQRGLAAGQAELAEADARPRRGRRSRSPPAVSSSGEGTNEQAAQRHAVDAPQVAVVDDRRSAGSRSRGRSGRAARLPTSLAEVVDAGPRVVGNVDRARAGPPVRLAPGIGRARARCASSCRTGPRPKEPGGARRGAPGPRSVAVRASRASINRRYAPFDTVLSDGDELVFIPPVSGG